MEFKEKKLILDDLIDSKFTGIKIFKSKILLVIFLDSIFPLNNSDLENSKCPICYNLIKNPYHPSTCLHYFCKVCITKWANKKTTCPICREFFLFIFPKISSIDYEKLITSPNFKKLKAKIMKQKESNYGFDNQCFHCKFFDEEINLIKCSFCELIIIHPQCDDFNGASLDGYYFCPFCRKELNMYVLNFNLI